MTSTIDIPASAGPPNTGPARAGPVRVTARLDEPLSRGLWLVESVVIGSVLLLGGVGAAIGGTAVLAADRGGRDASGFLNTPTRTYTINGYALVFDPLELSNTTTSQNLDALVGDIRVHAATPGAGVFIGIGPADAVDSYLAAVQRDRVVGYRANGGADSGSVQQQLTGGAPATPPTQQTFWVASTAGPGPQQLTWTVTGGRWAAVVMNADGSRPVITDLSAGAQVPALPWVWIGQYIGAGIGLIVGALLVGLALRRPDRRARV